MPKVTMAKRFTAQRTLLLAFSSLVLSALLCSLLSLPVRLLVHLCTCALALLACLIACLADQGQPGMVTQPMGA